MNDLLKYVGTERGLFSAGQGVEGVGEGKGRGNVARLAESRVEGVLLDLFLLHLSLLKIEHVKPGQSCPCAHVL